MVLKLSPLHRLLGTVTVKMTKLKKANWIWLGNISSGYMKLRQITDN